jgi:NADPH-dependent glutamate synthase beta subunit-like oxidoreductase
MPTGPKGEKRPADVIGNAVKVMRILTGEEPEDYGNVIAAMPVPGEKSDHQINADLAIAAVMVG